MGRPINDLTGQKFGRLTVIKIHDYNQTTRKYRWECLCVCGNTVFVISSDLKRGHTKSCGCFSAENTKKRLTKHGGRQERLYKIWCGMKERCSNPKRHNYSDYGGRGIVVCDEWMKYEKFREWALCNEYKNNLSLDRIDVNGNYEPSNCRWATMKTQQNNRRNNTLINFNGQTKTLKQWSEEYKINCVTLLTRMSRGWSFEKALTTEVRKPKATK